MQHFQLSGARDVTLTLVHTAYRHALFIDIYLHTKFHWNLWNFLWTDRRTFETDFIWSTQKSLPISVILSIKTYKSIYPIAGMWHTSH